LPIKADVSVGSNLAEMEERPDIEAIKPSWYQSGEKPPENNNTLGKAWAKKRQRGIVLTD